LRAQILREENTMARECNPRARFTNSRITASRNMKYYRRWILTLVYQRETGHPSADECRQLATEPHLLSMLAEQLPTTVAEKFMWLARGYKLRRHAPLNPTCGRPWPRAPAVTAPVAIVPDSPDPSNMSNAFQSFSSAHESRIFSEPSGSPAAQSTNSPNDPVSDESDDLYTPGPFGPGSPYYTERPDQQQHRAARCSAVACQEENDLSKSAASAPDETTKLNTTYGRFYGTFDDPTPPARPCSRNEGEAPSISERLVETPDYADEISISYRDCVDWLDDESRSTQDGIVQEVSDVDQDRSSTAGSSRTNNNSVNSKTQVDYTMKYACVTRYFQDLALRYDELEVFISLRNKPPIHLDADTRLRQEIEEFQVREHARVVLLRMRTRGFYKHGMRVGALYDLLSDTARELFH
jgi:hypothetical protein